MTVKSYRSAIFQWAVQKQQYYLSASQYGHEPDHTGIFLADNAPLEISYVLFNDHNLFVMDTSAYGQVL